MDKLNVKYIILTAAFIIVYNNLIYSQQDSTPRTKFMISLSAGAAIPIGDFSNYEKHHGNTGGAVTGINGVVKGRYLFSRNIGCLIKFCSISNSDQDVPQDSLYPDYQSVSTSLNTTYYEYESTKWNSNNFLAGFTFEFKTDNKVVFNFDLSCGYQQIRSPEVKVSSEVSYWNYGGSGIYKHNITQPEMVSRNFVGNAEIGMRLHIYSKWEVNLDFNFLLSHASFEGNSNVILETSGGFPYSYTETINTVTFKKEVTLLCINAGLSYMIK